MKPFIPYNYIGEMAGVLLAGLLLFIIIYTRPRKTYVFRFILSGTILSIISVALQLSIITVANNPDRFYNKTLFILQLIVFLLVYNGILYCIFSYVNMMSIVRRSQRKEFVMMYVGLSVVYVIGIVIEIAANGLYTLEVNNGIELGHFTRYYCAAGIVCAIICFVATITNRRDISRVIWHCVSLFVPAEVVLLLSQMILVGRQHIIFTAMTYVLVFALGFFLFHNVPYDEASGSQSIYALEAFIEKNLCKKKFYISYVLLKVPGIENFIGMDSNLLFGVEVCRSIEAISSKIRMYRVADDKFVIVIDEKNDEKALGYINRLRGVLDGSKVSLTLPFNYTLISACVGSELDSILKVRQFFELLSRRFEDQYSSSFYIAAPSDYDNFSEFYEISSVLRDIRAKQDLDDERIVVYAQPIYSVESGSFRSAEALMRLKIGDRIISPDRFIPIAEKNGAIHFLTCSILNKVCQAISHIDEYYDFDAISINVSSRELSQENMNHDLMDIIDNYDFPPSRIRLEVTETAMFEDYERAKHNMKSLSKSGIQFYLDDFGTGYSSLERVMNCPFKTIKFDKSLLYKSLDDDKMNDIMTHLIDVFKDNGFITLVEGVEDESQSQYSVDHGFDYIQGYHYAKPEPISEIKKYFARKSGF